MGNVLTTTGTSKPVGKEANLNDLAQGIYVNVVNPEGPFSEPTSPEQVETALVTDFWKDQKVVVHMLRRFGCPLCRSAALEISKLAPVFEKHNVRLVGVGLGYNSLDGFMESKVWEGHELYVDEGKKLYKALGLGQGGMAMLLDKNVMAANKLAKERKVGGNLKGDGMQLGGTYVVDKGGKVLMEFQQQKFGDHPTQESILEALGISLSELPERPQSATQEEIKCE